MVYTGLYLLLICSVRGGRSFSETYTVDHSYYTMSLYQDNAQGMYDKHFVDMSNSQVSKKKSKNCKKTLLNFALYCAST